MSNVCFDYVLHLVTMLSVSTNFCQQKSLNLLNKNFVKNVAIFLKGNFPIFLMNFLCLFTGGSPISLEYSGVALPPPSHTPPSPSVPHSGHLTNFTVSWGAQDVKMISMELDPNQGSLGVLHDPSYSPHQESIGSDHGGHLDQSTDSDGMCGDSKRKRKKPNFSVLGF